MATFIALVLFTALCFYIGWEARGMFRINKKNGLIDNLRLIKTREDIRTHGEK